MDSILTPQQRQGALKLQANYFSSVFLKNNGNGKFTAIPLPVQAQISILDGMTVGDYDGDGNLDVVLNGNDYGTEPIIGRYDALNGLLLKGDGKGNFTPLSISQSGIYIPGDGKALVALRGSRGKTLLAASQNKGPLKIFQLKQNQKLIALLPFDENVVIYYKDGKKQKREIGYGSSFLSQSGRFINLSSNVDKIEITDNLGKMRTVKLTDLQ
jgi:hypothetical protein